MNDDINIYDGAQIEGSSEAKSRNTWVEMFDMIGMFFFSVFYYIFIIHCVFVFLRSVFYTRSFIYLQKSPLNKTKYFRLRLSYKVYSEILERQPEI